MTSGMQLTVLGAGTAVPAPRRSCAGYLLHFGEQRLVLDMGPGTLARLAAAGVSYRDLDRIFISHLHPDHVLDLVGLLQANNATPGWTRTAPLEVAGCRGLRGFIDAITELFDGIAPEHYALNVTELDVGRHQHDDWTLAVALTGHTTNSLAFRVEAAGRVVVYSGDATEVAELAALAQGADLFVCECAFPQGYETDDHMTADAAGRVAQAAGVKRLVLTHVYPTTSDEAIIRQASAVYDGPVDAAVDSMVIAV
jgi:ribonuclease BN (tRNA processing enzyme)